MLFTEGNKGVVLL